MTDDDDFVCVYVVMEADHRKDQEGVHRYCEVDVDGAKTHTHDTHFRRLKCVIARASTSDGHLCRKYWRG